MDISIFGSDPPTHPPNMDKNKKRHVVFVMDTGGGWLGEKIQEIVFVPNELKSPKNNMFFCFFPHLGGGWFRSKCGIFHTFF